LRLYWSASRSDIQIGDVLQCGLVHCEIIAALSAEHALVAQAPHELLVQLVLRHPGTGYNIHPDLDAQPARA
jgi:hypothetical protein